MGNATDQRQTRHRIDPTRLARIEKHFAKYVNDGRLPGFQVIVGHGGHVVYEATNGQRDLEAGTPWSSDTIFRLYSNTKIVTAIAALMLWEEGAFELRTPLHTFIPAFKDTPVYKVGNATSPITVPQLDPIRMWQLFSHTSGLTYGFLHANPVDAIYRNNGFEWGTPAGMNGEAVCNKLAELPLAFQPGSEWNYGMSTDVLGRVVEICSGMGLDEFFRTRIFEPLDLADTGFFCPADCHDRLAALEHGSPTGMRLRQELRGAKDDVIGREGLAVVPLHALLEAEGVDTAVGRDRPGFCQAGQGLEVEAVAQQALVDLACHKHGRQELIKAQDEPGRFRVDDAAQRAAALGGLAPSHGRSCRGRSCRGGACRQKSPP